MINQSFYNMFDSNIDFEKFLKRHNLSWNGRPMSWDDCAFLGNGMMGTAVQSNEHKSKRNVYRFVMGRVDVTAKRQENYSARIPIGEFEIEFNDWIYGGSTMEIELWNAELSADVITVSGTGKVNAFIHSLEDVMVVEVETDDIEEAQFKWYPFDEVAPVLKNNDGINFDQYIPQIEIINTELNGIPVNYQIYNNSNDGCTVAFLSVDLGKKKKRYYCTIQNGHNEEVRKAAVDLLQKASAIPIEEYRQSHRDWWHKYYQKSFVSFTDTRLEGFYWIQLYKLASATRSKYPIMDNQGPWTSHTPWPGTWFNMNVQLAYAPVYTSNHLEIGESLCNTLDFNIENLIDNVPEEFRHNSAGIGRAMSHDLVSKVKEEVGNLPWACHNYYRQYRYCMDDTMLREKLYPLLRRSINYYFNIMYQGADGKLHIPPTISPEYGSFKKLTVNDCNYDLFLIRWGIQTLIQICDRLNIVDEQKGYWLYVLENLVEYPIDETGFLIGEGVRMEHGHRHYSHLLGVYPLHIIDCDDAKMKRLVQKSLSHWIGLEGDLRGFTFAGAASIAATMGMGNEALNYIKAGLDLFQPNTFYREAGPVIESPLGIAESINDVLLQSWGNEIRVFPAVPNEWTDIAFHDLRAEGAFLVSASRKSGKTEFIRVKSLAGEELRIRCDLIGELNLLYSDNMQEKIVTENGQVEINLSKNAEVIIWKDEIEKAQIRPITPIKTLCNYFGQSKPWRKYGIPFTS